MVEHICPKCNRKFERKSTFDYHISRKNSCAPEKDNIELIKQRLEEQQKQIDELRQLLQKKDEDIA